MAKFTVEVVTKNYWTVEVEADDMGSAEDLACDICQAELTPVSQKTNLPTLKYTGSEWEFYPELTEERDDG